MSMRGMAFGVDGGKTREMDDMTLKALSKICSISMDSSKPEIGAIFINSLGNLGNYTGI